MPPVTRTMSTFVQTCWLLSLSAVLHRKRHRGRAGWPSQNSGRCAGPDGELGLLRRCWRRWLACRRRSRHRPRGRHPAGSPGQADAV